MHKATCFDPSVGHFQAYIADQVIGAVCTLGSQYVYINTIHKFVHFLARNLPDLKYINLVSFLQETCQI